ncbi:MAG: hypothetical protein ACK4IS_10960 [Erythrobacter sp.]
MAARYGRAVFAAIIGLIFASLVPAAANAQDAQAEKAKVMRAIADPRFMAERKWREDGSDVSAIMVAGNAATASRIQYEKQNWAAALERGLIGCQGNRAEGCDIIGRVLAEGRVGAPEPRAAEIAHRKAASLYASSCKDNLSPDICWEGADFLTLYAVPQLRNPSLARIYYTRARDGYIQNCERNAFDCYFAGILTESKNAGSPDLTRAVRLLTRGCDQEDNLTDRASACNRLVELLAYGEGVQNQPEARRRIAGNQCSAAAPPKNQYGRVDRLYCAVVAEFLFDGVGGTKDPVMAERLMRFSCVDGLEEACQSLTKRGIARDDYKDAIALRDLGLERGARERFETLCTANNAAACNETGRFYRREESAEEKAKAGRFYARACDLGEMVGCANQAALLRDSGNPADHLLARTAFGKACDAGDAPSCFDLGRMLAQGRGGPADMVRANALYDAACNANNRTACFNLAQNVARGDGAPADLVRARALYEKSCELGERAGCNNLGYALEIGRGGPIDLARARGLYAKACLGGNPISCDNIGRFNRDGLGGPADPVAAREQFERACNGRVATGCNNFSDSLLSTAGGPTDRAKAITARRFSCFVLDNQDACTWLRQGGHRDPAEEGIILANSNRVDRALPLLREACNANSGKGCAALASATPLNEMSNNERMNLLRKACNLGDKDGCELLRRLTQQ